MILRVQSSFKLLRRIDSYFVFPFIHMYIFNYIYMFHRTCFKSSERHWFLTEIYLISIMSKYIIQTSGSNTLYDIILTYIYKIECIWKRIFERSPVLQFPVSWKPSYSIIINVRIWYSNQMWTGSMIICSYVPIPPMKHFKKNI